MAQVNVVVIPLIGGPHDGEKIRLRGTGVVFDKIYLLGDPTKTGGTGFAAWTSVQGTAYHYEYVKGASGYFCHRIKKAW